MNSRTTINVSADDLARAYFAGRQTGCVRAPRDLTSEGRSVGFIAISKGAHRVTLSGVIDSRKWQQTYAADAVRIDD